MSGEVLLSDEGGIAARLVTALAELTARVEPGTFALVGGLAVMARLRQVHRATEDIDGVCQQIGNSPSAIAVALGEAASGVTPQSIAGVEIDHIDVGSIPAASIPAGDLPDDEWDRAFVLAHRWGLDAATPATLTAVRRGEITSTVTCLVASPASLVSMKLQSAPRRGTARFHKAANDYLDLFRFLSDGELAPAIATDLVHHAPHHLGDWAFQRIGIEMIARADNVARALRHGTPQQRIGANELAAAAEAFLDRARWMTDETRQEEAT